MAHPRSPRIAAIMLAGTTLVAAGIALNTGTAVAEPTAHTGNATTCAQAGLAGDILVGSNGAAGAAANGIVATVAGGTTMSYVVNPQFTGTITGAVVKGGDNFNVYPAGDTTGLVSPSNGGGQVPTISHWFICGSAADPTTTTVDAPTTTEAPTTTTVDAPTTTEAPTTTTVKSVTVIVTDPGPTTTVPVKTVTGVAADPQPQAKASPTAAAPAVPAVQVLGETITHQQLAHTGFDPRLLVAAGLLLIILGAAVAGLSRQHQTAAG